MNEQEINRKIAELCGWKPLRELPDDNHGISYNRDGFRATLEILNYLTAPEGDTRACPDYCSDLNAMHTAEMTLTIMEAEQFEEYLRNNGDFKTRKLVWHAPADQRAEAFLRVKGEWNE